MYKIDFAYNIVQELINKDQRGKVRPKDFNDFAFQAINKLYADLFFQYRQVINKQNRFLLGSGLAKESHFTSQHLEYYWSFTPLLEVENGIVKLPQTIDDINYIGDIKTEGNTVVEKVESKYFNDIISHRFSKNKCNAAYRILGQNIEVTPGVDRIKIYYLRRPNAPKWTYRLIEGQPLFDPTLEDFSDLDIHNSLLPFVVIEICLYAGVNIREAEVIQVMNNERNLEIQKDNLV